MHRAAEPTIASIFEPDQKNLAAFELGLGLTGMPYQIPNVRIENPEAVAHTRIGWLRAVNNNPARVRSAVMAPVSQPLQALP